VEHIVDLAFWAEQNVAKDPSHLAHHVKFVAGVCPPPSSSSGGGAGVMLGTPRAA